MYKQSKIYKITEKRSSVISETNAYKKKRKLIDFLMRKGFENELIFKTVDAVLKETSKMNFEK